MKRVGYRQDREAILTALRRGKRPDLATTTACGPLDELVALHDESGSFRIHAVPAMEELLAALGRPVQESLLPFGGRKGATDA